MMKNANGGSIVNIGSMTFCGGDLGSTAYACAKAGADMLTQSVALQYGKSNIMVNRYEWPEDIALSPTKAGMLQGRL